MKYGLFFLIAAMVLVSCKKDPEVPPVTPTPTDSVAQKQTALVFSFSAQANNTPLVLSNKGYSNSSSELFTVGLFSYYLSNFKFTRSDGSVYVVPESYHLIKHAEGKTSFTVTGIPEGSYKAIDFLIGVDAQRNISGAQTGDLDVANNMFWDWDQGYVFFKLEGLYLANGALAESPYAIHVGGFQEPFNAIQSCHYELQTALLTEKGRTNRISVLTQIDEIFKNPKTIGIADYLASPGDPGMKAVSDNYADMFVISEIKN